MRLILHWRPGNITRYGISHFAKTLLWVTLELYALFSLTELLGIAPSAAASCFLVLLIWSAGCDLLVGRGIDRYLGSPSATQLMRFAGLAAPVAFAISLAPWIAGTSGLILSLVMAVAFRPLYSALDVPHNGLLRELGTSPDARMRLSTVRLLSGALAGFTVGGIAVLFLPGPETFDPRLQLDMFRKFAVVIALVSGTLFLASPTLRPASLAVDVVRGTFIVRLATLRVGLAEGIASAFAAVLLGSVGFSIFQKAIPYIAKLEFGDARWTGIAVTLLTFGKLISTPMWWWVGLRLGNRRGAALAYALVIPSVAAFTLAPIIPMARPAALFLLGAAMGGASLLSWALVADIVDRVESGTHERMQASIIASFMALTKLAIGIGGAALGWTLTVANGNFVVITTTVLTALALAGSISVLLLIVAFPSNSRTIKF